MKKVVFIPYVQENPYQSLLAEQLNKNGVNVIAGGQLKSISLWGKKAPNVIHIHWLPDFKKIFMAH